MSTKMSRRQVMKMVAGSGIAVSAAGCTGGSEQSSAEERYLAVNPEFQGGGPPSLYSFLDLESVEPGATSEYITTTDDGNARSQPGILQPGFLGPIHWRQQISRLNSSLSVFGLTLPAGLGQEYSDEMAESSTRFVVQNDFGIVLEGSYDTDEVRGAILSDDFEVIEGASEDGFTAFQGPDTEIAMTGEVIVASGLTNNDVTTVSPAVQNLIAVSTGSGREGITGFSELRSTVAALSRGTAVTGAIKCDREGIDPIESAVDRVQAGFGTESVAEESFNGVINLGTEIGNIRSVGSAAQELEGGNIGLSVVMTFGGETSPTRSDISNVIPSEEEAGNFEITVIDDGNQLVIEAVAE